MSLPLWCFLPRGMLRLHDMACVACADHRSSRAVRTHRELGVLAARTAISQFLPPRPRLWDVARVCCKDCERTLMVQTLPERVCRECVKRHYRARSLSSESHLTVWTGVRSVVRSVNGRPTRLYRERRTGDPYTCVYLSFPVPVQTLIRLAVALRLHAYWSLVGRWAEERQVHPLYLVLFRLPDAAPSVSLVAQAQWILRSDSPRTYAPAPGPNTPFGATITSSGTCCVISS